MQSPLNIIGPPQGEKHHLEVVVPDNLDEWPSLPGFPKPSTEYEEMQLVSRLQSMIEHGLESEQGLFTIVNGNIPAIFTNRDPEEILESLRRTENAAMDSMFDPIKLGLGSIQRALFQTLLREKLLEQGEESPTLEPLNLEALRGLLNEILPTAATRMHQAEGEDKILAAQLICLCRATFYVPGGPLVLFPEGMHPIVNSLYYRAKKIVRSGE